MIFLNPAILFGLLAASIPVILHFLNLRKIKKVEFSTLIFLKELQKTKIKKYPKPFRDKNVTQPGEYLSKQQDRCNE